MGEAYYVPDAPLSELVKALQAKVPAGCVRRSWPVSRVEVLSGAAEVRRELWSSVVFRRPRFRIHRARSSS